MRGLDGNYINTQGDASTRMQVAYQAEQNRQQIRAQLEAEDSLRKLREQVNEAEKKDAFSGPLEVKDDQGSGSEAFRDRKSTRLNSSHTVISYAVFCLKKKKNECFYE